MATATFSPISTFKEVFETIKEKAPDLRLRKSDHLDLARAERRIRAAEAAMKEFEHRKDAALIESYRLGLMR
jgi:hypothetical protein